MRFVLPLLAALSFSAPSIARSHFQSHKKHIHLFDTTLSLVEARLAETATDTWVSGTRAEALLELYYPSLSVFSPSYDSATGDVSKVEEIVEFWEEKRQEGSKELAHVDGGAAGDPPSLGVAWLVTAENSDPETKERRWEEATRQLEYLLQEVPRTQDGAISHRPAEEKVQLWNDFVYMVPPFLAYYGVQSHNVSLVKEAYEQCRFYRQYLRPEGQGAWKHVMLGDWQDAGLWATGNGWAAAGMIRVLATMQNSQYANLLSNEMADLKSWTREILVASFATLKPDAFILNYFDNSTTFTDSASSALLAATTYRLAVLDTDFDNQALVSSAATIRAAVHTNVNIETGWMSGAVNPLNWTEQTEKSPEAQAFVLLLHAAHRDYQATLTVDNVNRLKN